MNKLELIAQLDSARWQLSRDFRAASEELGDQFSVKTQLQKSIKRQPSAWGVGAVAAGFAITRLVFRKKSPGNDKKASYRRPRSIFPSVKRTLAKTIILAFEPVVATMIKDHFSKSSRNPSKTNSHV